MARPKGSKNKPKAAKAAAGKAKPKSKVKVQPAPKPQQAVTGKDVTGMITKSVLNDILITDRKAKKAQGEIAGELGSKIASAVERFGTNRKALGIIRTLNRMEPEKIADFLDHFDYMLDISGIEERAAAVQRLPTGEAAGDGEDAGADGEGDTAEENGGEEAEGEPDNVVSHPFRATAG